MPSLKNNGKGQTGRFNIRLDDETAAFYRSKAREYGMSLSEFLRNTLVQGVICENVCEIEQRLQATVSNISAKNHFLPEELWLSILNSEAILTAIIQAKGLQQLYAAQEAAKKKFEQIKLSLKNKIDEARISPFYSPE